MNEIKASIAGNIWMIEVAVGDDVSEDHLIVIMESMKMEIPIHTKKAGKVTEIKVSEGDFVNEGDVLVIID